MSDLKVVLEVVLVPPNKFKYSFSFSSLESGRRVFIRGAEEEGGGKEEK